MFALQKQIGWQLPDPLMMFNPPWLLTLAMPFSLMPYALSRMIWFLLQLLILFIAADTLWKVYAGEPKQRWLAWLVVLAFGPTLQTLKVGQVTPFMTLGLAGVIYFLYKEKPFWAGVMASLGMFKPHLLYLFLAVLILWILKEKQWRVLSGLIAGVFFPLLLALLVNHNLITQYLYAVPNYPPTFWIMATIGSTLRLLFGEELFYLQFIPSIFGLVWLFYYWLKNSNHWDWKKNLPLIILISIVTTSYGWAHDLSILVVSIIPIVVLYLHFRLTLKTGFIFFAFWTVSLLNTFLNRDQHWFWWLASFFLAWFFTAKHWLSDQSNSVVEM